VTEARWLTAENQYSAYDNPYLIKLGLSVTARRGTFTVTAAVNGLRGDEASTGINLQLSLDCAFWI
jgi:hypothetical protein